MRPVYLAMSVACWLTALAAPAVGQGSLKDSEHSWSTRHAKFGGKTLTQWLSEVTSPDRSRGETAIKAVQMWPAPDIYQAGGGKILLDELAKHRPQDEASMDLTVRVNLAGALGHVYGGLAGVKDIKVSPQETRRAVAMLTGLLADSQMVARQRAAEALAKFGPEAGQTETIRRLVGLVNNLTSWEVRQAGALALGAVAGDAKNGPARSVIDVLAAAGFEPRKGFAGGEPAARVRMAALQSLTTLGGPASPDLKKNLVFKLETIAARDSELVVQIWAHMAIMSVEREITEKHVNAIGQMLVNNSDASVRVQAAQALATIGEKAKSQVPRLIQSLQDNDATIVGWCTYALVNMRESARPALPALNVIKDKKELPESVRRAAAEAVSIIQGTKKTGAP